MTTLTSWPSGLGNVCQCMPTSVVGGFKYFVVIIAPLLRWESATIHIPIGSVARGRQPCLDQIEDPNLRCLLLPAYPTVRKIWVQPLSGFTSRLRWSMKWVITCDHWPGGLNQRVLVPENPIFMSESIGYTLWVCQLSIGYPKFHRCLIVMVVKWSICPS